MSAIIISKLSPNAAEFQQNSAAMQAVVDDLYVHLRKVVQGGSERARAKHLARGKLLPRERVDRFLYVVSPFLEVAPIAAHDMYGE